MITLPNPLPIDSRALQVLYNDAIADRMNTYGEDFITAAANIRLTQQGLCDALNKSMAVPAETPILSNVQRAAIVQPSQDTTGLYRNATVDELQQIRSQVGSNWSDPAKADDCWSTLVGYAMRTRGLEAATAQKDVSVRFPALKSLCDSLIVARKLGAELPPNSDPANPIWSSLMGQHTPTVPLNRPLSPPQPPLSLSNPFPIPGVPPLGSALGNDMSTKGVRQTYADALKKHMAENPDDSVYVSHGKVLKAHPALAAALRKKNPPSDTDANAANANADDPDPDSDASDTAATVTANERTALANSYEFTAEEKAVAREALVLANEATRTHGSPRCAMVQTARGWAMADTVIG